MLPLRDHVLCKPRIIFFHEHFIKLDFISFHIIGGHIVNHEQDLGLNIIWKNLGEKPNQLATQRKLYILQRSTNQEISKKSIRTLMGVAISTAAAKSVLIFNCILLNFISWTEIIFLFDILWKKVSQTYVWNLSYLDPYLGSSCSFGSNTELTSQNHLLAIYTLLLQLTCSAQLKKIQWIKFKQFDFFIFYLLLDILHLQFWREFLDHFIPKISTIQIFRTCIQFQTDMSQILPKFEFCCVHPTSMRDPDTNNSIAAVSGHSQPNLLRCNHKSLLGKQNKKK